MDLKQLRYFLAIVEERQITAAARRLHMAQPPLSNQMKMLEDELGMQLFRRGPHHIELTDAGHMLAERAEELLSMADQTKRELQDLRQGLSGTLSLGTVSSSGNILQTKGIHSFREKFPHVRFEIHDGNTYQLINLLEKGLIEIGIVRTPFNASRFNCKYRPPEPMIAAMTPEFDWAPEKKEIGVAELAAKPLIIYRRFEQILLDTFAAHDFSPEICCLNDDARTTILWANAGLGIAVAPFSAFTLAAHDNLRLKTIQEKSLYTRLAAIWPRDRYLSVIAQNFLEHF
ncbi:LysR family transcriptional regulator [uncultured Mitsuokella sp.]|uniref:LysR family transcriptional regulator n=1 Tax=uncultured Mitsuokella sp. TaxID=453120 RepID=UPI0025CB8DF3|nr:LysR family transcriptional regulator [uncultured Mitsuokella sp.]